MTRLDLSLLGGFRLRLASDSDVELRLKKARALLAYLAMHPGQPFLRDRLATLLWGDLSDDQARHNLRQALFALRRVLPPGSLVTDAAAVALAPDVVGVDVIVYERLASETKPDALAEAARLYRGDFLDGFVIEEPTFEEWLQTERERLREVAVEVLARLLAHQIGADAVEPAIQTALRLLSLDPLQEATHRTLMRLYRQQGRRAAALRQYQLCVDVLQRELGAEPEDATRQLYQEVLPERATTTLLASSAPTDERPSRRSERRRRGTRVGLDAPMIGRAAELSRLRSLLHDVRGRRGRAAVLVGEAGIGKTRLVEELGDLGMRRGVTVLTGRAYETAQVLPFAAWVDALRTEIPAAHQLRGFDPVWRAELGRLFPELTAPEPPSAATDVLRLFEAVTRFAACVAQRQPLMLILEDLHWADDMTLRLLSYAGRRIAAESILIVTTVRAEELVEASVLAKTLAELRQHAGLIDIPLGPLSRADTAHLVRSLAAGGAPGSRRGWLEDYVWRVSEGNPLLALETIRAGGEIGADDDSLSLPLPNRVREIVIAHLDRLSARSRQLAATASVIGREFDFTLLQTVVGLPNRDAAEAVEELVRRRVLRGVGDHLDFTHDRIREAAGSRLLPVQRRLLHRQIGSAIETVYGSNLEPHYSALARHHREGEVWDRAVHYLRKAAAQARGRFAYRQAAALLEQALDALGPLPDTRDAIEAAIDIRCDLRMAVNPLADDRALLEHLETAQALAKRIGDGPRLVRALTYLAREHSDLGAYPRAIEIAREAVDVAERLDDPGLDIAPRFYVALTHWRQGEPRKACDVLQSRIDSIVDGQRPDHHGLIGTAAVFYRTALARSLAALGHFDDAIRWGAEGLRLAEAAGHPYGLGAAYLELGTVHLDRGAIGEALPLLARGLDLARSRDLAIYTSRTAAILALGHAIAGGVDEARALLDTVPKESFRPRPKRSLDSVALLVLGRAHLAVGCAADAEWCAERALAIAREFDQREVEAGALCLIGDLVSRRARPDLAQSERCYRQSLALAGDLGLRPQAAQCHAALATLYQHRDDRERANEHLRCATTMYRQMGIEAVASMPPSSGHPPPRVRAGPTPRAS